MPSVKIPLTPVQLIRRIDEVHAVIVRAMSGDMGIAVDFMLEEFAVSRGSARRMLDPPGNCLFELDFLTAPEKQAQLAAHGIVCDVQMTRPSPWAAWDDEAMHRLLYDQGWTALSAKRRIRWSRTVRKYFFSQTFAKVTVDREDLVVTLDTESIADEAGFFIAMGEAVHGPGGYLGACLDSFKDCLCGDFGVKLPLTVRWHGADPVKFADLIELIRSMGVRLELQAASAPMPTRT